MKKIYLYFGFFIFIFNGFVTLSYATGLAQFMKNDKHYDVIEQCLFGHLYFQGKSIFQSYTIATDWYKKGVNSGDGKIEWGIGYSYENGQFIPMNQKKAAKWYENAAKQGDANAQAYLGNLYVNGSGVSQNNEMAYMWLTLAAEKVTDYQKQKNEIAVQMTKEQIERAEKAAEICLQSNYQKCMIE